MDIEKTIRERKEQARRMCRTVAEWLITGMSKREAQREYKKIREYEEVTEALEELERRKEMLDKIDETNKIPLRCPICKKLCGYVDDNGYGTVYLFCKRCKKEITFYHADENVFCKTDK